MPAGTSSRETIADAQRYYENGNAEVKHLLENECIINYLCKVCNEPFNNVINFISHKRTLCRASSVFEKNQLKDEFLANLQTEAKKNKEGLNDISAIVRMGKSNLDALLKDIRPTLEGNPPRPVSLTQFNNGYQTKIKTPVKPTPENRKVVVVVPKDLTSSYGEMSLRKKRDNEKFAELTKAQVEFLSRIPDEVVGYIDTSDFSCRHPACKTIRPFQEFECLVYHLSVNHQPPVFETCPFCYFCGTQLTSFSRLKYHMKRVHALIRSVHLENRARSKQKRNPRDRSSISPATLTIERKMEKQRFYPVDSRTSPDFELISKTETKSPRKSSPKKLKPKSPVKRVADSLDAQISAIVANAVNRSQEESKYDDIDSQLNIKRRYRKKGQKDVDHEESPTGSESSLDHTVSLIAGRMPRQRVLSSKLDKDYVVPRKFKQTTGSTLLFSDEHLLIKGPKRKAGSTEPAVKPKKICLVNPNAKRTSVGPPRPVQMVKQEPRSLSPPMPILPVQPTTFSLKHDLPAKHERANKKDKDLAVVYGKNDPFLGKPRQQVAAGNNSPLKSILPSLLIGADQEAETLNSPKKATQSSDDTSSSQGTKSSSSRRKQNFKDDSGDANDLKLISIPGHKPTRPSNLLNLPVLLSQTQRKMFFGPLKPLFSEKEVREGKDGLHQCSECGSTCRNLSDGQKHMIGHVRAIRMKCSLCDVGAFFCADIRKHLMYRYCEYLHLAPQGFISDGTPCMDATMADKLIKIADVQQPGKAIYTPGKIITNENPVPYFPDPKIENRILGSLRPNPQKTRKPYTFHSATSSRGQVKEPISSTEKQPTPVSFTATDESPRTDQLSADSRLPMTLRLGLMASIKAERLSPDVASTSPTTDLTVDGPEVAATSESAGESGNLTASESGHPDSGNSATTTSESGVSSMKSGASPTKSGVSSTSSMKFGASPTKPSVLLTKSGASPSKSAVLATSSTKPSTSATILATPVTAASKPVTSATPTTKSATLGPSPAPSRKGSLSSATSLNSSTLQTSKTLADHDDSTDPASILAPSQPSSADSQPLQS